MQRGQQRSKTCSFKYPDLSQICANVCGHGLVPDGLAEAVLHTGYGPTPPQRSGSNSSSGAIPADAFAQPTSAGRTVSDLMGREIVTKKDTFDFVTDHLDTLKISK